MKLVAILSLFILGCSETGVNSPVKTYYCSEYYTATDGITGINCRLHIQGEPLYKQKMEPYIIIKSNESYGK